MRPFCLVIVKSLFRIIIITMTIKAYLVICVVLHKQKRRHFYSDARCRVSRFDIFQRRKPLGSSTNRA